eukprot:1728635-Alexandrium_andersonii.AAC.1
MKRLYSKKDALAYAATARDRGAVDKCPVTGVELFHRYEHQVWKKETDTRSTSKTFTKTFGRDGHA